MVATKVTLLFNATTQNPEGTTQRLAGFSESYYSTLAIDNPALKVIWNNLCIARAALLSANTAIIGSRYQNVDPVGASRQYDTVYPSPSTAASDLPSVALQWTVRSLGTFNQRSVILRGVPDARVANGEYSPIASYNTALGNFFNELRTNWQFRAIDRSILPVKIASIIDGVMTTLQPHSLAIGNHVKIMSTLAGSDRVVRSYEAVVTAPVTTFNANLFMWGGREAVPNSVFGRVRKATIIYPSMGITPEEIVTPNAITRKVGSPFRKFRGRRTAKR